MPETPPNPPRSGHPGKPPPDDGDAAAEEGSTTGTPHSYGQSAPMADDDSTATIVHTIQPQDQSNDDDPRDTVEDLAGEPIREANEDEPPR